MKKKILVWVLILSLVVTLMPLMGAKVEADTVTYTWPTTSRNVVGNWGYEPGHYYDYHYGIDIVADKGAKVYAAADGKVIGAELYGSYGYCVRIKHANGQVTLYGHNSRLNTKKGDSVKRGDVIAYVGGTGSEGAEVYAAHCHFGIYKSESALKNENGCEASKITINPKDVLKETATIPWVSSLSIKNSSTSGKPYLTWNKRSSAAKYKVYRKKSSDNTYKLIGTTTNRYYTDTKAIPSYRYYYFVKAINKSGKTLQSTYVVDRTCDLAQPKLTGISNIASHGGIKISFSGVKNANCYKLYRAISASGTYEYLFKVDCKMDSGGESHYFINSGGTPGKTYYYKVQAINTNNTGADSALSKYMYRTKDLAKPVVSATTRSDGKIVLNWEAVSYADKYEVYRAVKGGKYSKIYTTTGTTCTNTKNIKSGKTYYYKVRALKNSSSAATSVFSKAVSKKYIAKTVTTSIAARDEFIKHAGQHVGERRREFSDRLPDNGYGIGSGYDWCVWFVQHCAAKAGLSYAMPTSGYTYVTTFSQNVVNSKSGKITFVNSTSYDQMKGFFTSSKRSLNTSYKPKKGDLIIYSNYETYSGDYKFSHIGIVYQDNDSPTKDLETIEGNVGNSDAEYSVVKKYTSVNSVYNHRIVAYITPNYK